MPGVNEFLLNNAVGEDLQRALRPFDLVRKLFLVSKYRIKDNFITPHPRKYYILSLVIMMVFLYAYKDISYCMSFEWCLMIIYALHPVAYATVIVTAAYQSEPAIELVTKMQKINKKLRVIGASVRRNHPRRSWYCVICVNLLHGSKLIFKIIKFNILSAYTQMISSIVLDLEILYAAFVVDFLMSRLESWTMIFLNSNIRPNINTTGSNYVDENTTPKFMFGIVKDILETFVVLKTLSQCVILIHATLVIVQCLFNAATLIMLAKNEITNTQTSALSLSVFIVSLVPVVTLILLSIKYERFDCSIERLKKACVAILEDSTYEEKSIRRLAKNVLRLCNVRYSKIRACGLFTIDAVLPLRMISLITTYYIVLLQFAFL